MSGDLNRLGKQLDETLTFKSNTSKPVERMWTLLSESGLSKDLPLSRDTAVIAGSSIVNALFDMGDKWQPNDIDIFCTRSAVSGLTSSLVQHGFGVQMVEDSPYIEGSTIMLWCRSNSDGDPVESHVADTATRLGLPPFPEQTCSGDIFKGGRPIQLIVVPQTDVSSAILGRFDMDIFENMFDGQKFRTSSMKRLDGKPVTTFRPESYMPSVLRLTPADMSIKLASMETRIAKVYQRGIKMLAKTPMLRQLKAELRNIFPRMPLRSLEMLTPI
jgi:hypothetical protein